MFSSFSKSQCDHFNPFARDTMGLKQFSVEDINTVLGIFLVNDFEINSSVGIMNVNMLYMCVTNAMTICSYVHIVIAIVTYMYMRLCKTCSDDQVEKDVDMYNDNDDYQCIHAKMQRLH